jgi:hypothetical protein
MLQHSFCHIKGISLQVEASLWDAGILHWDDVPSARPAWLTPARYAALTRGIEQSRHELADGNPLYFQQGLPRGEHWRLFGEFRNATAYFDIETTGLAPEYDQITTIALFDGKSIKTFVNGKNLESFCDEIENYAQIVTYNGKCFDVPFIRKKLRTPIDHAHLDLRYLLSGLGYKGGLKGCEKRLGVRRDGVEEVNGFMAVLLWNEYRRGNEKALDTLLAYNIADAVNLEILSVKAYNMYLKSTPFGDDLRLDLPDSPDIPYRPDQRIIRKLAPSLPAYY